METYLGLEKNVYFTNAVTEIVLDEGAVVAPVVGAAQVAVGGLDCRRDLEVADIPGLGLGLEEKADATPGIDAHQAADDRENAAVWLGEDRLVPPRDLALGAGSGAHGLDGEELAAFVFDGAGHRVSPPPARFFERDQRGLERERPAACRQPVEYGSRI